MNYKLSSIRLLGSFAAAALMISACGLAATAQPATPVPTVAATAAPTLAPTVAPTLPPAATETVVVPPTTAPTTAPTAAPTTDAGVLATTVPLFNPVGIAFDAAGKLYVGNCVAADKPDLPRAEISLYTIDQSGVLKLAAGSGIGFGGDGGPVGRAQFLCMGALAFDGAGNLYIADQHNNNIRRIDPDGTVSTVAGNSEESSDFSHAKGGFAGDGGPATEALLSEPTDIAFDSQGNLYILDSGNNRVRKVDTAGMIATFAGEGTYGFSGDGGPATEAKLSTSNGLAIDAAGNVYIADSDNARIRKVDLNGIITTIAGTGELGYSGDGGPATEAQLSFPARMAVDAEGSLYFADEVSPSLNASHVRKIDKDGIITTITTVHRGEPRFPGEGPGEAGLAVDSEGNLYIADRGLDIVKKVDKAGVITTVAGGGS